MKTAGKIVTGFAGAAALALAGCSNEKEIARAEIIKQLEFGETIAFSSIDDCKNQGYSTEACEHSRSIAHGAPFVTGKNAWPRYEFKEACLEKHRDCEDLLVRNEVADDYIPYSLPSAYGWEALKSNIGVARQTYLLEEEGQGDKLVGVNGRTFEMR